MTDKPFQSSFAVRAFALLLLAAGFSALFYLLKLRYDSGDSMPRGSSLRSDPLGVEVLYESLNQSALVKAERNHLTLAQRDLADFDMLIFMHGYLGKRGDDVVAMHNFVTNHGGRLMITLPPVTHLKKDLQRDDGSRNSVTNAMESVATGAEEASDPSVGADQEKSEPDKGDDGCGDGGCFGAMPRINSTNLLWQSLHLARMDKGHDTAELNPAYQSRGFDLPPTLPVRTLQGILTNDLGSAWQTVYLCGNMAVVLERKCEKGSVVVSTLSYPFSNEAMRSERETNFILWALGSAQRILFDESHFGLVNRRTVAKLFREHKLHYAFFALLIPVALFFWMTALCLVPRYESDAVSRSEERDSTGGALCNLLHRSIPTKNIVLTALERWQLRNSRVLNAMSDRRRDAFYELVNKNQGRSRNLPREKEIVAAYNEIVALLNEDE